MESKEGRTRNCGEDLRGGTGAKEPLSPIFLPHTLLGTSSVLMAFFFFLFYIGVQLINNVVLVSGVQQSGYTYTCSYSFSNSFPI